MRRFIIAALALAASFLPAHAQVRQSGTVTAGHAAMWTTNGVIQDAGSAAGGLLTSLGVTNNGGPGICIQSAASGQYNRLCMSVSTAAAAQISLQNVGGATAQALQFDINGTISSFVTATGSFTANNAACFQSSAGVLIDCGMTVAGGVVSVGTWNATPIAVAFGGTGAVNAANARTNLGLGTMSLQDANTVAITGGAITGMSSPTAGSDVATKTYVDSLSAGLIIYPAMTLATAAVLPNTPTYANGASGVGATLTAGTNTTLTVDATAAPLNTLVLVKNQVSTFQNGFYYVSTAGSGGAAWVLTRCTLAACGKEFDTAATMLAGSYATVTSGATLIGSAWVLAGTVTTVGTTAATFNLFSNATLGVSSLNSLTGGLSINAGTGISVTPAGSNITIANTLPGRTILASPTSFYIRTDGSDSNTCLVNNSGGACLTLQGTYDKLTKTYDFVGTGSATVNIGAGTYNCAVNCLLVLGQGSVGAPSTASSAISFVGDNSTPSNVTLSAVGASLLASWNGQINISGVKSVSTAPACVYASAHGRINFTSLVDFGACASGLQMQANVNGVIVFNAGYYISGSAVGHIYASANGVLEMNAATVSCPPALPGCVPAYGTFATAVNGGVILSGADYSLSATGIRYIVDFGTIATTGSLSPGVNHFPGTSAGATTVFGGKYQFLLKRDLDPAANDNTPMFLNEAA